MPYISKDFIAQKLMPAVHIEEVVGHFLTLKQKGANLSCCCPFHHEKTPSFIVTPSKQTFHCFGCKEHGNAIDFLMRYKNIGFVEAVEELCQMTGIPIEYEAGAHASAERYKAYYELMDRVAAAFSRALEDNAAAQDYFYKKRGLTRKTVITCRLGYAPNDWNYMRKIARSDQELAQLKQLGLIIERHGKSYPFFRDRVMIPIADSRGRIVSFGGRVIAQGEPKYLNTAENPIFRKRHELFGLYAALQAQRNRPERLVIVEGYMDVISLQQAGITYAVASLGTATTVEQFRTMFRYSKQVICCYDGDSAGRRAAWHALETATAVLEAGLELRFTFLPPEHDPDSLVREQGAGAFTQYLDKALSYPEFLIAHIKQDYDLADLGQRSSFIATVLHKARLIAYQPLQAMVLERLSEVVGIEGDRLYKMLDEVQLSKYEQQQAQEQSAKADALASEIEDSRRFLNTPMRKLIAFLLQQPTVVAAVYQKFALATLCDLLNKLQVRGAADAVYLLQLIDRKPDITPGALLEELRDTPRESYCRRLLDAEFIPKKADGSEFSIEDRAQVLAKLIAEVLRAPVLRFVEELKMAEGGVQSDAMNMMVNLNRRLAQLREGWVVHTPT